MPFARCNLVIQDENGNIQDGCSITVQHEAVGFPLLSVPYSDRDGLIPLGNPFTSADGGDAGFYAAGGSYRITASKSGFSREWRHVAIGLLQEKDDITASEVGYTSANSPADIANVQQALDALFDGAGGGGQFIETLPADNEYTPASGVVIDMYHAEIGNGDNVRSIPNTQFDVPGIGPNPPAGHMFVMANYADSDPGNISNIYSVAWQSGTRYAAAITGSAVNTSGGGSVWGVQGMGLANGDGAFCVGGQFDAQVGAANVNANAIILSTGPSTATTLAGTEGQFPATAYQAWVANPGNTAGVSPCSPLYGIYINANSTNPINNSTGKIMAIDGANLSCPFGIDFNSGTFATAAFRSPGFSVDGDGDVITKTVSVKDQSGAGAQNLQILASTNLTSDRTLTLATGDRNALIQFASGDIVIGGSFTTSGAHSLTLTTTANTNVTFPTSGTLLVAATQADQETGTSTTLGVTPGRQQYHPSAAKVWVRFNGTGTVAINGSYNVTSLVDNGTGNYRINYNVDFANATTNALVGGTDSARHVSWTPNDAGFVDILTQDNTLTAQDTSGVFFAAYGDQ